MNLLKKISIITFVLLTIVTVNQVYAVSLYTDLDLAQSENAAIKYITDKEIVEGYPDGSFKPENTVSRAEFTKIIVNSFNINLKPDPKELNCFTDVTDLDWFAPYVCYAKNEKIVEGYPNGQFKPAQEISLVEALKIVYEANPNNPTLEPETEWYQSYLNYFTQKNYIPESISSPFQKITRRELAEIVYRNLTQNTNFKSPSYDELTQTTCQSDNSAIASNVDAERVRQTWLDWSNQVRSDLGLQLLNLNDSLNFTATEWSNISKERGYIDHKRDGQTAYYDFKLITNWFTELGIEFENINSTTFTETIGWEYYTCESSSDCTQGVIDAINSSFEFIMSEKNKASRPHYNSLINPNFSQLGLGIALDPNTKKYYLTAHYGTELTTDKTKCS
jgi:uncharacterized protein YkwD